MGIRTSGGDPAIARAPHTCRHPDCDTLIPAGAGSHCPAHQRRSPDRRPSAARRGYGPTWTRVRDPWVAAHRAARTPCDLALPGCTVRIDVPDHHPRSFLELVVAGEDPYDLDRWCRPVCRTCHNRRSARDRA